MTGKLSPSTANSVVFRDAVGKADLYCREKVVAKNPLLLHNLKFFLFGLCPELNRIVQEEDRLVRQGEEDPSGHVLQIVPVEVDRGPPGPANVGEGGSVQVADDAFASVQVLEVGLILEVRQLTDRGVGEVEFLDVMQGVESLLWDLEVLILLDAEELQKRVVLEDVFLHLVHIINVEIEVTKFNQIGEVRCNQPRQMVVIQVEHRDFLMETLCGHLSETKV